MGYNRERREAEIAIESWFVDDDTNINQAIMRSLRMLDSQGYSFLVFESAELAWGEVERRNQNGEAMPDLIFVDGDLRKDSAEWNRGEALISRVRSLPNITQPQLIAHSSEQGSNDSMINAGADKAIKKPSVVELKACLELAFNQKQAQAAASVPEVEPVSEAEDVEIAILKRQIEIQTRLERYQSVDYQIYDDTLTNEIEPRSELKISVDGYPKYYGFIKDVDYLCQYAIAVEADSIVFLDKSARGFGLLSLRFLPILALEMAQKTQKNPNDIKIPQIQFFNANSRARRLDYVKVDTSDYYRSVAEQLGIRSGQTVIFFDESSGAYTPLPYLLVDPDGTEPHRWDIQFIQQQRVVGWGNGKSVRGGGPLTSATSEIRSLGFYFPDVNFRRYLGGSGSPGGLESTGRLEDIYIDPEKDYGIKDPELSSEEIVKQKRVFVDRTEDRSPEIHNHQKQVRDEQSRMAYELFRQVILHQDPYHHTEG